MRITSSSTGKEIEGMALAIHELVNKLPLTMRSKEANGVRIEDGEVIDYDYTGPVLEKVLKTGNIYRETPKSGPYAATPVVVVPIVEDGEVICAVGIVDITKGVFSDIVEISRRPEPLSKEVPKGEFY